MADHDTHDHTGVTGVPADIADIVDIPTAETDDTLVLAPDGVGGVEFRAEAGGTGAPDTATYITVTSDAGLSAEVPRPELDDQSLSGSTPVTFTSPTSDDGSLTLAAESGMAQRLTCTEVNTRRHAYVASSIGTGDFDIRARIVSCDVTSPGNSGSTPFAGLFVADSSLTTGTRLSVQQGSGQYSTADGALGYALGVDGTTGVGTGIYGVRFPSIHRITRSGTTITRYVSLTEGRVWMQLGSTTTSSLNVGRVGILMLGGSTGSSTGVALVHWIRTF